MTTKICFRYSYVFYRMQRIHKDAKVRLALNNRRYQLTWKYSVISLAPYLSASVAATVSATVLVMFASKVAFMFLNTTYAAFTICLIKITREENYEFQTL